MIKKKINEPKNQTTVTSAPIKGSTQDQSGVGVSQNNADYTISDEAILGINPGAHMHPQIQMRATARGHTRNAPSSANELQAASNTRRIRLSRHSESERMDQKKDKEQEIGRRKMIRNLVKEANLKASVREDDDDDDWEPGKGSASAKQYNKMSDSDKFGARYSHDREYGLLPKGGAAVGDDEIDDMHKREYDSKNASGHGHLISPKNPYNTPGYTGPKDSYGKSKADWAKEAAERRDHIEKHGMDSFNKKYGYPAGSPRHQTFGDDDKELEKKINTHNMLKANGMKSPYGNDSTVKESKTFSTIKRVVREEFEQSEGYMNIGPADGSSPYDKFGNKKAGTRTLGKEKQVYKSKQQRDSESAKKFSAIRSNTQKEEVEQIDEISKKLAARYNNKVAPTLNKNQPSDEDAMRKRKNREAGSKLSYNKYHGYKTKVPATEEVAYVEEAKRGRPKMNASDEDPGSEHIMMQMRKVITTRGMHPVQFNDGKKHQMNPATAHRVLSHHDNLKTSQEKQEYAARVHRSKDSMNDALSGKPEEKKPKITLGGNYKK